MALSNLWSTTIGQNSQGSYGFLFENPDGTQYPITGLTWEYVIRTPAQRAGQVYISITPTATANGFLTVTTTPTSMVQLTISPAATTSIPPGQYDHALWSNPGTDTAYLWFTGSLIVQTVAQP